MPYALECVFTLRMPETTAPRKQGRPKQGKRKKPTNVTIAEPLLTLAKREAFKDGISLSAYLEKAITLIITKQ